MPPEGLDAADVQRIWWSVAGRFSRDELREKLLPTVMTGDWGCFAYHPIAEISGSCRYPWPIVELIQEILPPGVICPIDQAEEASSLVFGMLVIQVDIWYRLIWRAFEICPVEALPEDLQELRLQRDIGL